MNRFGVCHLGKWTDQMCECYFYKKTMNEEHQYGYQSQKADTIQSRHVCSSFDLAKAGSAMTIKVKEHDKLLGTIEIGQGSFRWMPAHGKLGLKRITWRQLYDALNEYY